MHVKEDTSADFFLVMFPTSIRTQYCFKLQFIKENRELNKRVQSWVRTFGTRVKPYEDIPGPAGHGVPLFGHMNMLYRKPAGFARSWENLRDLKHKYCDNTHKLLRLHLPLLNPDNGRAVILMDPLDVEEVYRHEGKYPRR